MIEVPVFEFGQNAPVVAESGEGGPATAPGYTLHGVWYEKGSDIACCWQVRDDTISLCAINVKRVQERTQTRQPRRLRFEGAILPKPSLFTIKDHQKDLGMTHHLVLCTSKGELKIVPLKLYDNYIETNQSPFPTIPLQNTQRVTSCNFIQKPDGSVKAFIGTSYWGQRDTDGTLAEVKIIDIQQKDLSYKDSPALKFSGWVGGSKNVTTVAACSDPCDPSRHIIITLHGNDAVIYKAQKDAQPQLVVRFSVDTANDVQFNTDISTAVSGQTLIVAFIKVRPTNSVHTFKVNLIDCTHTAMPSLPCPIRTSAPTRASIRTTSTALYIVWQAEPHHTTQESLSVPLLFAALPSAPCPQLAITRLPLEGSTPKEWQMVDLESKKRAALGYTSPGQGEMGLCVIDGRDIADDVSDVCCIMRPSGMCVLREADPLETEGIIECVTEHPDDLLGASEPLDHPFISYSVVSNKGIHQGEFLRLWKQADTVISLAAPVIDTLLVKLLSANADDLPSLLVDVEFLLFMENENDRQHEVVQVDICSILKIAAEIRRRVDQGYTREVSDTPLAAFGTAQQIAFSMLLLSLHRAALLSVARHIAVGDEFVEVKKQHQQAIDSVVLYTHVHAVLAAERVQTALLAYLINAPLTSTNLFNSLRDIIHMLMSIDNASPSALLISLLSSPVTTPGHIQAILNLRCTTVTEDYKSLVIKHICANLMVLESDQTQGFFPVAESITSLSAGEQTMFLHFIVSLLPCTLNCDWGIASLGVDTVTLYLYLSACALVFLDDSRRLDNIDLLSRSTSMAVAVRAAAVAVMPPVERLLSEVPVWSQQSWDIVTKVNKWSFDAALDRCGKAAQVASNNTLLDKSSNWDTVFRTVLSCPDIRVTEQHLSALVETLVTSGSLSIQRFIAANWTNKMISPIELDISNQDPSASLLTVTLPARNGLTERYAAARDAAGDIVISVVSCGHGVALKKVHGCDASEISNTVLRIQTTPASEKYQISVAAVQDALRTESRPLLLLVSFAGLMPVVTRCNTTSSSLSLLSDHAYHAQPSSIICKALWSRGNDKFSTDLTGRHGGPNYFHVLAQFLAYRSEYCAAARATFRIAEKIRAAPRAGVTDIEAAARALSMSINFLKVGKRDSLSLLGDDPLSPKQEEQEIVTIQDLENRRVTVEAELALLRAGDASITPLQLQQSTWEQIQEMLLSRKLFVQAATFADSWKLDQQRLFMEATKACLAVDNMTVSNTTKDKLWNEVLLLLERYSIEEVQWKYHVVMIEVFLKECGGAQLPPSRASRPLKFNRPDLLIREYMRSGMLVCMAEAVMCASEYLRWQLVGKTTDAFTAAAVLPVTLLDTLTFAAAERLKQIDDTQATQLEVLFQCRVTELLDLWSKTTP